MRHEGPVENRAVYVAIGINLEGKKDVVGLWASATEGAKFWLSRPFYWLAVSAPLIGPAWTV